MRRWWIVAACVFALIAAGGVTWQVMRPSDVTDLTVSSQQTAAVQVLPLVEASKTYVLGEPYSVSVASTTVADPVVLQRRDGDHWVSLATRPGDESAPLIWEEPSGRTTLRVLQGESTLDEWPVDQAKLKVSLAASGYWLDGKPSSNVVSVGGAPVGTKVVLEAKTSGEWSQVGTAALSENREASIPFDSSAESAEVRARIKAPAGVAVSETASVLRVSKCTPGKAQKALLSYTSNDPTRDSGRGIVDPLVGAICAAEPAAAIDVSLYILVESDKDVRPIINALIYKALVDKNPVRFLLEGTKGGVRKPTLDSLARWSEVITCVKGCTSYGTDVQGINHNKFVAIADMEWAPGDDPWVWYSSANWSNRQLREYWHNAVSIYNDSAVYRDTAAEMEALEECSLSKRECDSEGLRFDPEMDAYGHTAIELPTVAAQREASISADFFPKTDKTDPAQDLLRSIKCTPGEGGTVQIAGYLWSKSRANRVVPELERLHREGCRTQIIASFGGLFESADTTMSLLKRDFIEVVDRSLMHLKTIQATNVTFRGASDRFVWYGGAQNFTAKGLRVNNENMLLVDAPVGDEGTADFQAAARANWLEVWTGKVK